MGYIGNQTSNSYTSLDKQTITGNGGASYTLDHAVANEQEIEVFVNNVRQEPSVAYTVSGTALTMTGNVESSDDFYVVFQGKAIQTVVPPDLTVDTAKIKDNAVTSAKIADDAVTTAKTDFYEAGTWTPVFADATSGGNASPTTAVTAKYTKVGSLVHVNFRMDNIDRTGLTSNNNAYVRGLPYQPNAEAIGTLWSQSMNTHSTTIYCVSRVFSGNSYIRFENVRDNTSDYTQTVGDFGDDTADISVTLTYTTNG